MREFFCSQCEALIAQCVPGVEFIPPFALWGYKVSEAGPSSGTREAPVYFCSVRCLRRWLA